MTKKMVTVRIDEDILRAFDESAWKRRLSRTAAIELLMRKQAEADGTLK